MEENERRYGVTAHVRQPTAEELLWDQVGQVKARKGDPGVRELLAG